MRYWLVALFCLLFAGCATQWAPAGGVYNSSSQNFSVTLPDGWMRAGSGEPMIVTRDGVLLQNIRVERIGIDKDLKNTKKKLAAGMRPLETAEVILDDLSSDQSMVNVTVLESRPVTIGGHAGFRTLFGFRNSSNNLRMKSVYYGVLVKESFYSLRYSAAERYYFDKDIEAFEKIYKSFKIIGD